MYDRRIFSSMIQRRLLCYFFFFNDTATTEIYTLSLHDALPICPGFTCASFGAPNCATLVGDIFFPLIAKGDLSDRSEEHTSELQSQSNLVCRLLLEKKKKLPLSHPTHARSVRTVLV